MPDSGVQDDAKLLRSAIEGLEAELKASIGSVADGARQLGRASQEAAELDGKLKAANKALEESRTAHKDAKTDIKKLRYSNFDIILTYR